MANLEQYGEPLKKLQPSDEPVEQLLRELAERNPGAVNEDLQHCLDKQNVAIESEPASPESFIEKLGRMMEEKARAAGGRGKAEEDVSLLLETLDELNLTLNDISINDLMELGDIEAGLCQRYLRTEEENEDE